MKIKDSEDTLKVYRWASQLTAETKTEDKFYETEIFRLLKFKIMNTEKGLIAISGLQGTGKTRMLRELVNAEEGEGAGAYIKWSRDWRQEPEITKHRFTNENYQEKVKEEGSYFIFSPNNRPKDLEFTVRAGMDTLRNDLEKEPEKDLSYAHAYKAMQACYGKSRMEKKLEEFKKEAVEVTIRSMTLWLVDMPDYSKSNMAMMNSDIDELQRFWEVVKGDATERRHIVIGVQKELVMKNPHFFWGKCDLVTLEPLAIEELLAAYKFITGDQALFGEDALRLLGQLSRGIFRRFKKYIRLTIEKNQDAEMPLSAEHVGKAVTETQLFEDMELELTDIFKDFQKRRQAVSILSFLRANPNVNMKMIEESLGLSKFVVEKLVPTLSIYGYVTMTRGLGKEFVVSLKL